MLCRGVAAVDPDLKGLKQALVHSLLLQMEREWQNAASVSAVSQTCCGNMPNVCHLTQQFKRLLGGLTYN
eukprot:347570-Chlamydomonas_euryale.AAC.1